MNKTTKNGEQNKNVKLHNNLFFVNCTNNTNICYTVHIYTFNKKTNSLQKKCYR